MIRATTGQALIALLGGALLFTACDNDPSSPQRDAAALIAGSYTAAESLGAYRLITVTNGEEIDWLARGAEITLTLRADGTTTGRLYAPGAGEDGGDFDVSLAGTFAVAGDVVEFEHEADTFIRDMPFRWEDGRLTGDRTFGAERVTLELVRQ